MSIRTAILADSPALYWPLDDPTGPAASDASGNGHPGVYAGVFNLGLAGPEVGTFAALLQQGGFIFSAAPSPRQVAPFSIEVWFAPMIGMPDQTVIGYNGRSDTTGTGMVWRPLGQVANGVAILRGGISVSSAVAPENVSAWHQYVATWNVSQQVAQYVDGVQIFAPVTFAFNAIGATDVFSVGGVGSELAYAAHAALFSAELTATRVAAHFAANTTPQNPSTVQGTAVVAGDVSDILKAVRKTF